MSPTRILGIALALVPFLFGLIRAFQTGTDFRYLWLAIAALVGAALVMVLGKAREATRSVVLRLSVIAFLASTLVAILMGRLLGSRSAAALTAVAVAFGLFSAAGQALYALPRRETF